MKRRAENALHALFYKDVMSSWHMTVCVEKADGTVGLTLSAPVVNTDEGPSSHFGITPNPMDGRLLAQ